MGPATKVATDAQQYWAALDSEVSELCETTVGKAELPIRSTHFSTLYGVTLQSTGGARVFGYYSVPTGVGPFPAVLMAPGYGSVVDVPPHDRRRKYVVLALCARGQRLSDVPYAASFPGLLTDDADDPLAYPFRGIAADCLRAMDLLASSDDVDAKRIAVTGVGDLPVLVGALRPTVRAVMADAPFLFRDTIARLPEVSDYPLEEFNDLFRVAPHHRDDVAATLSLFDPVFHARRVRASVRVAGNESDRPVLASIVGALPAGAELYVRSGRGAIDYDDAEAWLESTLA